MPFPVIIKFRNGVELKEGENSFRNFEIKYKKHFTEKPKYSGLAGWPEIDYYKYYLKELDKAQKAQARRNIQPPIAPGIVMDEVGDVDWQSYNYGNNINISRGRPI